eukprot:3081652-Amphidinium_carterae.1
MRVSQDVFDTDKWSDLKFRSQFEHYASETGVTVNLPMVPSHRRKEAEMFEAGLEKSRSAKAAAKAASKTAKNL